MINTCRVIRNTSSSSSDETIEADITIEKLIQAAECGDLIMIKRMMRKKENRIMGTRAIEAAAAKGHLPVIEFLTSLGIIEIGSALERAALAGHLDVLDFLQQNTIATCTSQVMDEAAIKGDLAVVQWLHRNRPEGCTTAALIGAAANGHREIVEFLVSNRGELGQYMEVAFDAACGGGHWSVIQYAVEVLEVGCSPEGLNRLALRGDIEIMNYLLSKRIIPEAKYIMLASDLSDAETGSVDEMDEDCGGIKFDDGNSILSDGDDGGDFEYSSNDYESLEDDDVSLDMPSANYQQRECNEMITMSKRKLDDTTSNLREADNMPMVNAPGANDRSAPADGDLDYSDMGSTVYNEKYVMPYGALDVMGHIQGEIRNEPYRKWSPNVWRRAIDCTMDTVVVTPHRLTVLPWMYENMLGRCSSTAVQAAARVGYEDVLKWLWEVVQTHSKTCSTGQSAKPTDDDSSNYYVRELFNASAIEAACGGGQLGVAKWLCHTAGVQPTPAAALNAAIAGPIALLEWLHLECNIPIHPDACDHAAMTGNIVTLKWLMDKSKGAYSASTQAVDVAAENGHLEVVQFLSSLGVYASSTAADAALLNGHTEVVQFLQNMGAHPSQYAVRYAALPWPTL
mmetsp:Transcript_9717/g.14645  ORF Transcript_9717/g.14645 Transcript_9717/m.14645 type:complete len:625 (+) Transcript_9717:132-2006(+)|eukprot:CAMPEP_0185036482 /NCGR_PEP_ID=MMETSP1103-20130426/29557_1 /TAXON_ID=36769 /ORGANISM="Paraphysomonas bandaiensis, Strain Caron Lab Isolate" /LENGTH=624 /DNA_ID=CAMNT_0027574031 /DNA_START=73 /DNA_END=1950 /DNA_ORIENTATION=+